MARVKQRGALTPEQALVEVEKLSIEEQTKLLELASKKLGVSSFYTKLEDLIEHGFEIPTMTPLQRAICRIVQGAPLGDLVNNLHLRDSLGLSAEELLDWELKRTKAPPFEVMLIAGIRTFKSTLMAAMAIWASQTIICDPYCGPGDIPRYSIVSVTKDNAAQTFAHLMGAVAKKNLASLVLNEDELKRHPKWRDVIKEASEDVVGRIFLKHPTGRPIEVRVVAGKRAGSSVVSRWCAGLGLDEAPRMVGADEGVVNYKDMRAAVLGRLLPGAPLGSYGSPWQPRGPVFDKFTECFGRPTDDLVIFKAKAPWLNPIWWTPERCADLKRRDPVQWMMDVEAEFADIGEALIPQVLIAECTRKEPDVIEYDKHHEYNAAMDPATRSNAWTLIICDRYRAKDGRDMKRVCLARQWVPGITPLRPRDVLKEIKEDLAAYGLTHVTTDQWAAEALQDIASGLGVTLVLEEWNAKENMDAYLSFRAGMEERCVELPPDPQVAKDIRLIRKQPQPRGPTIRLATTADGRHCDYAPAIVRALKGWLDAPRAQAPNEEEALKIQLDAWREERYAKVRAAQAKEKTQPWLEVDPFADPDAVFDAPAQVRKRKAPWMQLL